MVPRDFTDVASGVLDLECDQQARLRTAVGRAYYAVYLAGRAAIAHFSVYVSSNADSHEEVASVLSSSTDREIRALGDMLGKLRRRRNDADYVLYPSSHPETDDSVEATVLGAYIAIETLDTLILSHGPAAEARRHVMASESPRNLANARIRIAERRKRPGP